MEKTIKSKVILGLVMACMMLFSALMFVGCGHEHKFETTYTYDEAYHWFACEGDDCDEVKDKEAHEDVDGICQVCFHGAVAKIIVNGETSYATTLPGAVATITDDTQTTIVLLNDASGDGVVVKENRDIIFDLDGHTYTLDGNTVGSVGTENNGFQLLRNSNITFKNGGIKQGKTGAKILIQNYSNLTLENVIIDGRVEDGKVVCGYTLSNNFGAIKITGNTQIIAEEGKCAFDLYYGLRKEGIYDAGVTVTFDENYTGSIIGGIEYGAAARASEIDNWEEKTTLTINGKGKFDVTFGTSTPTLVTAEQFNFVIKGGSFSIDVSQYCASGYECKEVDGRYVVGEIVA